MNSPTVQSEVKYQSSDSGGFFFFAYAGVHTSGSVRAEDDVCHFQSSCSFSVFRIQVEIDPIDLTDDVGVE